MRRRTRKVLMFCVGAGLLGALPVVGSLVFTYVATLERERARVDKIAGQVADQVYEVLWTTEGALADLAYTARNGCTSELILELRNKAAALYAMRGLGYITGDGYLACTSYGRLDPPVRMAETQLIRPQGSVVMFTPPIRTTYTPGVSIVALHQLRNGAWIDVLFSPELLLSRLEAGALGEDGFVTVTMQGVELASLGEPRASPADMLRARRDVGLFETEVIAAISRSTALAEWRKGLLVNGGVGLLAGLVLVAGAAHLASRRFSLGGELKDAIEHQEFEVHYQPVIDLQRDRCVGAEALIRWRHPERGLVPPDSFIGLAEETGAIIPITRWLMHRVGEEMGEMLRGDPDFHIAINLAPAHFNDLRVVADAKKEAEDFDLDPAQFLFEVTERGLVDDDGCRRVIDQLSEIGSKVAVDDFGTGYSSLAYIEKFNLNYLKIDKAFVKAIGTDAATAGLAQIIIDMAHALNLKIIAEGAETEDQVRFLRERGVDTAQGWYYSKPLPASDFIAFTRRFNAPR